MQQPFSSARVGPISGLVGSALVLLLFFLPQDSFGSAWDGIVQQGIVEPMVALVLIAALALFGFSAAALLHPSPALEGLSLLAASVGLLAQVYLILASFMNIGVTLTTIPRFFSLLASGFFPWGWGVPLLGFLLSEGGIAFATLKRGSDPRSQEGNEKEQVWSIKKRHILAMVVGVLLYGVLSNLSILWEGPGEGNLETVFPAVALVLFFGVVYGPWVGLVTGGLGSFLNNAIGTLAHAPYWILSNYWALNSVPRDASHPHVYWPLVVGNALVGFLAGLPLFGTAGRDKTIRSLLAVMLRSALAFVVGFSLSVVLFGVTIFFRVKHTLTMPGMGRIPDELLQNGYYSLRQKVKVFLLSSKEYSKLRTSSLLDSHYGISRVCLKAATEKKRFASSIKTVVTPLRMKNDEKQTSTPLSLLPLRQSQG